MEKQKKTRKRKWMKIAAVLFLFAASVFMMPQKAFAEENEVTLPTGDLKPVEPERDENGIDTYGESGEEFQGTELELYSILEERVKAAMLKGEDSVSVRDLNIRADTYDLSFYYGYSPYFPSDKYGRLKAYYGSEYYTRIVIENTFGTAEETKQIFRAVDQKLASVYELVNDSMTEEQKALTIHDYLDSHAEYDTSYSNYTSYGVLMDGKGVCQSYAFAYMYILNHLGIETHLISSRSMNHAWNVVKIDGDYYNVDCTFDDPLYDRFGQAWHTYFLRSTGEMEKLGHVFDTKPYECTSEKYSSAFWRSISSPIVFLNGNAYYIKWQSLYEFHLADETETVLSETETFKTTIAQKDGELYYCSKQRIYGYLPESNVEEEILDLTEQGISGSLSGVRREKNHLEFLASSEDGSATLYYVKLGDEEIADGWHEEDGAWYYYKAGEYLTGWQWIHKNWYLLGEDGVMKTGWQKEGDAWYYLNRNGAMQKGWQKLNNKWYYLDNSGVMQTGWQQIAAKWYYLNKNGVMQTDWQKINNKWYYLDNSGVVQVSKWISDTYYVKESGVMAAAQWIKAEDTWYYFQADGTAVQSGWKSVGGEWYYFKERKMQQDCWIGDYYVLSSGKMAKSQWIGNYYVGADGKWEKGKTKVA